MSNIKDRIKFLTDKIKEGFGEDMPYLENIWALKNDRKTFSKEEPYHYKFNNLESTQFTDVVAKEIANGLKKSTKATGLTLFHGNVTDNGMAKIIEALQETHAPVQKLNIDDFPLVTDKSMKLLPDVIKQKGIMECNVSLCNISPETTNQINSACQQNVAKYMQQNRLGRS